MKILMAVLTSLLITLAIPMVAKDCVGNSFLDIGRTTNPSAVTMAYSHLIDKVNKPCAPPTIVKRTLQLHKWQDTSGVWHYSDATANDATGSDNRTVTIEQNLYSNEEPAPPVYKVWLPFALIGFYFSTCALLYLLMTGVEKGLQFFRGDEIDAEDTTAFERQTAGEALEFFSRTPYEVLGISAKASMEEVEAAYERQLSHYHQPSNNNKKGKGETTPDHHRKLISLHQAFEAIKRKKQDKFLATTD